MRATRFLIGSLSWLAMGCVGSVGEGLPDDGGIGPLDPEALGTSATDLRRLSARELGETLRDLVGDEALLSAKLALSAVPTDRSAAGAFASLPYSTEARGVTSTHVDAHFEVFLDVAEHFRTNPAALQTLAPCLPGGASDATCVEGFISDFGARVFRRPLTDEERASMFSTYTLAAALSPEDGVALVILRLLASPSFLYRLEIAGAETETKNVRSLTDYEIASRLSYLAWGTMPDDALFEKARAGLLVDGLDAEIDRVFADPRATARAAAFFDEWLNLDHMAPVDPSAAFLDGLDPTVLQGEIKLETSLFLEGVFERGGTFRDLMESNEVSLPGDEIARLYGVSRSTTSLPDTERAGILTRAGFLAGPGISTHPIRRGAAIRRFFMCDEISLPDPSSFPPNSIVPPPFDPNKTARERWTAQTSPENCASCHVYINAPGFVLESFDAIGRHRESEPVVDPATGQVVNDLPIDTSVELSFFDDEQITVKSARDLAEQLAKSDEARRCFATHAFRFSEGRHLADEDEALLSEISGVLGEQGIKAMLESIARAPSFRVKKVMP